MHRVLCEFMRIPYKIYNGVMGEVFAITAARTIATFEYDKPLHKTALYLIKMLETSQRYANKPLHRKFAFLLDYPHHEALCMHASKKRWI